MIRRLLFVVAALGVALAPHGTEAATAPVPTVELIGWMSGFSKALEGDIAERHSITVGPLPEWPDQAWFDEAAALDEALDAWNRAAGWELFIFDPEGPTDVSFDTRAGELCPNAGACTNFDTFDNGRYRHIWISFWPWPGTAEIVAHELGHALGFRDVDDPADPYQGIMRHGRMAPTMPDNEQDVASLTAAGYRG